jgi:hypothetical protein
MHTSRLLTAVTGLSAAVALTLSAQQPPPPAGQQPPAAGQPPPQQQSEIKMVISGAGSGLPPKLAVPGFIALTGDAETQAAAKTVGDVLWDDLEFEKEFYMIPRDTYKSIPGRRATRREARARPRPR